MADPRDVGEDAAIQQMVETRFFDGDFTLAKAGHHAGYYATRRVRLDFRGTLCIHPASEWGSFVTVITWSHSTETGKIAFNNTISDIVDRPVRVDEGAFIGSLALLYNCHIKHHAIVACGAVVRNMTVEPYTVVEGNPARAVKKFINGKWVKL